MASSAPLSPQLEPTINIDKLSYEIFSILESRFLFGYGSDTDSKLFLDRHSPPPPTAALKPSKNPPGKVRILSIDSGGATDGILSARSLALLEDSLRSTSHNPDARIADYFDVVSGSGAGGVLAALLFTRGDDGRPLLSAAEAQRFLVENRRKPARGGAFRRIFGRPRVEEERVYKKLFSENTLKDTLKTVLVPCYDLASNAPFLFSRADALETDGYDFRMREVCFATSADPTTVGAIEMRSVDGRTRIVAVDGGVAMSNPTAAAITHVLNNKQEFPFCRGVEDLLVVSLGNGESGSVRLSRRSSTPSAGEFVRIAGDGVSDMVDQAVSMSFGHCRASNYVRIQIHHASHNWGFFQVIHHDIPISVLDNTISAVQSFKELPVQVKTQHYQQEMGSSVSFQTNFDLYRSSAATWRGTLQVQLGPEPPDVSWIPEVCRREVMAWDVHVRRVGDVLMGLLS